MQSNQGFIQLYRDIMDTLMYSKGPTYLALFVHLVLKANYADGCVEGIKIKKGQLVTSVKSLSKEMKLTSSKIRNRLEFLQSEGLITIKGTNKFSIITIVNYGSPHMATGESSKQTDNQLAIKSQQYNKKNKENKLSTQQLEIKGNEL